MKNSMRLLGSVVIASLLQLGSAVQAETIDHSAHSGHDHAKHQAMLKSKQKFARSQATYNLPAVTLLDQSGLEVAFGDLNSSEKPQAINFIFATCTTICPVMTATFAQMRRVLGDDADRFQMLSITIDPQHDTPAVLAEYAGLFDAPEPSSWSFLTGHPEDVEKVLRSFDAWTGSKANHKPITLLRAGGDDQWLRLEGLGSGADLAREALALLD